LFILKESINGRMNDMIAGMMHAAVSAMLLLLMPSA